MFCLTFCARAPVPASRSNQVDMPRVLFPDGYAVHVEIAADPATREQGLMYRDRLREQTGMLFLFPQTGVYPFWMKNTLIPLDILWVDEQKRVAHVKYDVPPCRTEPCPSYDPAVPARYVLEVAGGVARQQNVTAGSQLRFEGLDAINAR
jgi:uncharacterized membrane protein (UPF0127 family)